MGIGPGRRIDLRTWVYDAATNENVFDLGRVLTDEDDNRSLNADVSYISDGIRTYDHWDIEVRQLRRMISHPLEGTSLHETAGHVVTRSDGDSLSGIGYLLSDDILALTAEATAPTDAENALPVVQASYSASNFTQQSGNYFVFRAKDDSTLWIRSRRHGPTRLAAHTLTITATPMGGGGGDTAGSSNWRVGSLSRSLSALGLPLPNMGWAHSGQGW